MSETPPVDYKLSNENAIINELLKEYFEFNNLKNTIDVLNLESR